MIVYELTNTEAHPVYRTLEAENGVRQYDFMHSMISASLNMGRPFLSQQVMKAFNFHAIACLHINAGEYRPCQVYVGGHVPPEHYRVAAAMDDFVNSVNRNLETADPVFLATFTLWKLNNVHPFINGNGRTARASAYYVLCLKLGGFLPGTVILPELIKRDRAEYCVHLQHAHDTFKATGTPDLAPLHAMMQRLVAEQIGSAGGATSPQPTAPIPILLGPPSSPATQATSSYLASTSVTTP